MKPFKIPAKAAPKRQFEPWDLVDMAPIAEKRGPVPAKQTRPRKQVEELPCATGETPAKVRQERSKRALLASGGKRVAVNLSAQAVADLEVVKVGHGVDSTQAIALALRKLAG